MAETEDLEFASQVERIRRNVSRVRLIGVAMVLTAIPIPLVIYFIQFIVPVQIVLLFIMSMCVSPVIGIVVFGYYGGFQKLFLHNIETLDKLAPPHPIIIGRRATLVKEPVYAFTSMGSDVIMFVAFREYAEVPAGKVKMPRNIWIWEYNHAVGDYTVARREGTYAIPYTKDCVLEGEELLYAILTMDKRTRVWINYTRQDLEKIVAALAAEVTKYGSRPLV